MNNYPIKAKLLDTYFWGNDDDYPQHPRDNSLELFLIERGKFWDDPDKLTEIIPASESSRWEDVSRVGPSMKGLQERLKALDFQLVVIQLSHFGISDPLRRGFVATMFCAAAYFDPYFETIHDNLKGPDKSQKAKADASPYGSIGPSPALYQRPFWHSRIQNADISEPQMPLLPDDQAEHFFTSYQLNVPKASPSQEEVDGYIRGFHERMATRFEKLNLVERGHLLDFIVIPFMRLNLDNLNEENIKPELKLQGGAFFA